MKRREFIQNLGLLSGSLAFGMNGVPIQAFSSPLLLDMEQTNGKILVLLQMNGGNDGLNTVIPFEDSVYYNKRPKIGIAKDDVLKLNNLSGLNPAMAPFKELYDTGKLSIVQNVGYENPNRSHFRSTDIWLSASDANQFVYDGWMGRYLNQAYPEFPAEIPEHPMAVQLGSVESMLLQSPLGSMSVVFENPTLFQQLVSGSKADMDPPPATVAGEELKFLKQIAAQSVQYASVIKETADKSKNLVTYPNTNLGRQLAIVAELISGGMLTPVYLTTIGGFDTHANQLTAQANLLKQVTEAVAAFQSDIEQLGVADNVVLMTFSEFGRRLNENGSLGTDHGTAAPLFVIGKSVKGGFIGTNPNLNKLDNSGDIIYQHDYRQIYTTILQDHLGLNDVSAQAVLGKSFDKLDLFRTPRNAAGKLPFELKQNFPNPVSTSTTIEYALFQKMAIQILLLDMTGRLVTIIREGQQEAGNYFYLFDKGRLAAGDYILTLTGAGQRSSKRIMIL
jgi:uncharacterized protein (DUF1501 family)